ncbi:hypothetical protein O4215_20515 [Rhodococcus maanshanensis]|uniref:hypothetical protein n=1 Tax=Rhodococcus maanshanensis TaxID=183556 RepID=UPI0022B32DD0|nr:hypothetical protein [Rhodococcus maanshanensis]MCZ4557948.1 hypothetical protein [Rhodococcus maanshanensis]
MTDQAPTRDDLITAAVSARFGTAYTDYPHDHPITRSMREEATPFVDGVLTALFGPDAEIPDPTSDMMLKSMTPTATGVDLVMEAGGPNSEAVLLAIADSCDALLAKHGAENYVEFGVEKDGLERYLVCVRRSVRPSPHDLRKRADQRAAALEARIANTHAVLDDAEGDQDVAYFVAVSVVREALDGDL